ncbi:sulfurtransferase TusA family protein [Pseudomonadota bacterium]|nr:sulfurtransferase TusA family protein [Pseudomonadota bacterium]
MFQFDVELDTSGLNCPFPLLKARKEFSKMTENSLLDAHKQEGILHFILEKGA